MSLIGFHPYGKRFSPKIFMPPIKDVTRKDLPLNRVTAYSGLDCVAIHCNCVKCMHGVETTKVDDSNLDAEVPFTIKWSFFLHKQPVIREEKELRAHEQHCLRMSERNNFHSTLVYIV
jgi:hypothetical protein